MDDDAQKLARNLDWNLLRMFIVIIEARSITLAASKLGLQQPSVSSALKRLETTLGRKLLERGPGKFAVTDAGKQLYREAVDIHGSILRLGTLMRDVRETVTGHVKIAMASHVICPFLDEVLGNFHSQHPKATLEIIVGPSHDVIDSVVSRQVSFGICLVHNKHQKLEYLHMFREYFGLYCGPKHPLFGREDLTTDDLPGNNWVSFTTDQLSDVLRPVTLLRATAAPGDAIVGSSANLEEVRRLILAGLGIGPLPIHVATRDVELGLLHRLPPYKAPPEIDVHIVSNPATKRNRAENLLYGMLVEKINSIPMRDRTFGM